MYNASSLTPHSDSSTVGLMYMYSKVQCHQLDSPLRQFVIVVTFNGSLGLLEAYVVESSKGCTADVGDTMVRNQEQFLICVCIGKVHINGNQPI